MSLEIEAKMAIDDHAPVRNRVREAGGTFLGRFEEINTFFDTEDRTLLAADKGLRLRLNRNADTGEQEHLITYKGPRQLGPLKSREEVELSVQSADAMGRLLECLGYTKMLSFEKRRESWRLDGCRVEFDELPFLGRFVEIEGPDEEAVLALRKKLALADRALIKFGYVALLSGYLQERGRTISEVRFGQKV